MDNREFSIIGVDNMDPRLYNAATGGNMEHLTSIMEVDCPPDLTLCLTPQKNTVLHIAVKFNQQEIVQRIIQLCPSLISQPNSKGDTPLHVTARAGHIDLTKLFTPALNLNLMEGNPALEEGNPVQQAGGVALRMRNLEGNNPIEEALKKSHGEVALHLLAFEEGHHELARDVNEAGESLLYLAAEAGLDEVVLKIIDTGDYSTGGPDGQNPLHIAVIKSRSGVVEILLDKASNLIPQVDGFGNTVLHYASAPSYCRVVEEDSYNNNISILPPSDQTRGATRGGLLSILPCFNQTGGTTEEGGEDEESSFPNTPPFVSSVPSTPPSRTPSTTPFLPTEPPTWPSWLGKDDQIKILRCLLEVNPSLVYVTNKNGDYPLFIAISKQFHWAVETILDHCPDSTELVNQKGQNALHLAVMEKNPIIIHMLRSKKLINEPDNDGNTPMHLATLTNRRDIVMLLIRCGGADLTMSNKQGFTAMDICGYTETEHRISKILRKSKAVPGRHQWQEQRIPIPTLPRLSSPPPPQFKGPSISNEFTIPTLPRLSSPPPPQFKGLSISNEFKTLGHQTLPIPPQFKGLTVSNEFKTLGLQTLPIVTSLVAAVTFAAAFTVPGGYQNDGPREGLPVFMRTAALQAFVFSDILAFCSSMAATVLLIYANLYSKDASKVYYALMTCYYISGVAILATITAFVTAVYVLTSKECSWLVVASLLLGSAVPLFLVCYIWGVKIRNPVLIFSREAARAH